MLWLIPALLATMAHAQTKTFRNSYVSFEVPFDWTCVQEGVAWTCTPQNAVAAKEAVIVLAAKVAGPEDSLDGFLKFLQQPKRITTKVGTPMPSRVMYAQQRMLANHTWVQAQHLGSEIQEYYTLYLATVKERLAILVSFSAERNRYKVYNPVFDKAMKTLRIVASQQLLFPKQAGGGSMSEPVLGIQGPEGALSEESLLPPPRRKSSRRWLLWLILGLGFAGLAYFWSTRKKDSSSKSRRARSK